MCWSDPYQSVNYCEHSSVCIYECAFLSLSLSLPLPLSLVLNLEDVAIMASNCVPCMQHWWRIVYILPHEAEEFVNDVCMNPHGYLIEAVFVLSAVWYKLNGFKSALSYHANRRLYDNRASLSEHNECMYPQPHAHWCARHNILVAGLQHVHPYIKRPWVKQVLPRIKWSQEPLDGLAHTTKV